MDFPRAAILLDAYPMRKILTPIQRYGRIMRTFPGKAKALLIDHAENWLHMRDAILAFYTGGPEWPPPADANKSARDKKPDRDSICKSCRTVLPPGAAVCPGCGKAREVRTYGGSGSTLVRVNGTLKLIDSVTGAASAYGGNLWPEVCTEALRQSRGDSGRAYKRALAELPEHHGQLAPVADAQAARPAAGPGGLRPDGSHFKAWIIAKRAAGGARA